MKNNDWMRYVVDTQNEIIRKQSAIIDELFGLVSENTSIDKLEPVINMIQAVSIKEYELNS